MLEHAVRLDFVKWRLEEAFFFQLLVVVILESGELLRLFVQKLEVGSALVFSVLSLLCLVVPVGLLLPLFVLFLFEVS
jgi:hypothetical protein